MVDARVISVFNMKGGVGKTTLSCSHRTQCRDVIEYHLNTPS